MGKEIGAIIKSSSHMNINADKKKSGPVGMEYT
jgi:hypothetical protein